MPLFSATGVPSVSPGFLASAADEARSVHVSNPPLCRAIHWPGRTANPKTRGGGAIFRALTPRIVAFGNKPESCRSGATKPRARSLIQEMTYSPPESLRLTVRSEPGIASIVDRLRRDLETNGSFTTECLVEASERIGVSPRTLQRHLDRSGTSFSAELERARRARAVHLLTTTERPLWAIAGELGFCDASSFSRAFQRWFARAPGAVRRALPAPASALASAHY